MTADQPIAVQPRPASFKNVLEVFGYVRSQGWKCGKTQLYAHVKSGKLRPSDGKAFDRAAVDKYASTFLVMESTRQHRQDEDLQRQKMQEEIGLKQIQRKREFIKLQQEQGLLVPRDQFYLELAARASVIDTLSRNDIQTQAAERVALVGGDPAKIPDLIQFDMAAHDDRMNQFATTKEFHVLFEKNSHRSEIGDQRSEEETESER